MIGRRLTGRALGGGGISVHRGAAGGSGSGSGGGDGPTPTYRSHSEVESTGTAASIAYPAGLAENDIMLLSVNFGSDNSVLTTPPGFTQIGTTLQYGVDAAGAELRSAIFWKRADGTETGTLDLEKDTSGGIFYAALLAYQGCVESGSPVDDFSEVIDPDLPYTMASITTTGPNRRCVAIFNIDDNRGRSNTPSDGWVNRVSLLSAVGFDGTIYVDDLEQVEAGSPANDTVSSAIVTDSAVHAVALKPT